MDLPNWRDEAVGGAKIRVALWLVEEVGEGGVFTKADLRDAFPGIEQIDRRMRDLRASGWIIANAQDDATLGLNQLRLVEAGQEVWRTNSGSGGTLTARERKVVLARDNYACVTCGIAAGESYPDAPFMTAQLSITRLLDGTGLVTECKRCRAGAGEDASLSFDSLLSRAVSLDEADRAKLAEWLKAGRRTFAPVDSIWTECRRLPPDRRDLLLKNLLRA